MTQGPRPSRGTTPSWPRPLRTRARCCSPTARSIRMWVAGRATTCRPASRWANPLQNTGIVVLDGSPAPAGGSSPGPTDSSAGVVVGVMSGGRDGTPAGPARRGLQPPPPARREQPLSRRLQRQSPRSARGRRRPRRRLAHRRSTTTTGPRSRTRPQSLPSAAVPRRPPCRRPQRRSAADHPGVRRGRALCRRGRPAAGRRSGDGDRARSRTRLRSADLAMVNLETAVTTRGTPAVKAYTFRAPATAFTALRSAGVDVVTMANNHGEDYGPVGLQDSLSAAAAADFPVVGIGQTEDAAFAPYHATVKGRRVAFIAATQVLDAKLMYAWTARGDHPGLASAYNVPRLLQAVRAARATSDVVVVYLHWGHELAACPTSAQRDIAHQLVDAGADVVVGHACARAAGCGAAGQRLRRLRAGQLRLLCVRRLGRHQVGRAGADGDRTSGHRPAVGAGPDRGRCPGAPDRSGCG